MPFIGLKGEKKVLELFAIQYVYSLSSWIALRARDAAHSSSSDQSLNTFLIVGDPENNKCAPLPGATVEVLQISDLLENVPKDNVCLLLGKNATESNVKKMMKKSSLVHIASHSFFDEDKVENSKICLCPSSEEDGWLHPSEIQSLVSNHIWKIFVMSSCSSGRLKQLGGDYYGFTRSLYLAGAQRVISTLWTIDDVSTNKLMVKFYVNMLILKQDVTVALRNAQRDLALTGDSNWMAFKLDGLGGRIAIDQGE